MIEEVIWTSGATGDFQKAVSDPVLTLALQKQIELLKIFPELAPNAGRKSRLRRALIGKERRHGLYYTVTGKRIVIAALLNLHQSSEKIEWILEDRGI